MLNETNFNVGLLSALWTYGGHIHERAIVQSMVIDQMNMHVYFNG